MDRSSFSRREYITQALRGLGIAFTSGASPASAPEKSARTPILAFSWKTVTYDLSQARARGHQRLGGGCVFASDTHRIAVANRWRILADYDQSPAARRAVQP